MELYFHSLARWVKNPPVVQETQEMRVQSLGQEYPLEKEMAKHSSILAWRNLWTEETSRLQSMGRMKLQYFGHIMRRVDSLEKTLMLGGIGGRKRRRRQDEMAGWHQ